MTLPASGTIWMSQLNDEMHQPTTQYVTLADPMMLSMVGGAYDLNSYHGKSRNTGSVVYGVGGATSWGVPYGCYSITVRLVGGGGGTASWYWSQGNGWGDLWGYGGPGGAGAVTDTTIAVVPGDSITWSVGPVCTAYVYNNSNGNPGTGSYIYKNNVLQASAAGGAGGTGMLGGASGPTSNGSGYGSGSGTSQPGSTYPTGNNGGTDGMVQITW